MSLPSSYQKLVAIHPETGNLREACTVQDVEMTMPLPGDILVKRRFGVG
ncbi:MAG: hypothetical protein AAFV93_13865 [Chloroflexota bacterium]